MLKRLIAIVVILAIGVAPSLAAIVDVGGSSASCSGNCTSLIVNVPAGTVDGDTMIASGMVDFGAGATKPAGWQGPWATKAAGVTGGTAQLIFWCRDASSEPANYTWTISTARMSIGINSFRNALACGTNGAGAPTFEDQLSTNNGTSTAPSATGVTLVTANDWIFAVYGWGGTLAFTPPAGVTNTPWNITSAGATNLGFSASDKGPLGTGATGNFDGSITSTAWLTMLVGIKPSLVTPTATPTTTATVTVTATATNTATATSTATATATATQTATATATATPCGSVGTMFKAGSMLSSMHGCI